MKRNLAELLLSRVNAYLEAFGLVLTREQSLLVLKLVEDALTQQDQDPMAFAMSELPRRFQLPTIPLPSAFPPLERGSIGYGNGL